MILFRKNETDHVGPHPSSHPSIRECKNSAILLEIDQLFIGFIEAASGNENACHAIRIHVGSRAPVFEITHLIGRNLTRDTDGRTAVSHGVAERVPTRGLVTSRQTALVIETP